MVIQQCLSCNTLMTASSRACVCGHVLEEASRSIGGKRFSEYRARLYSRLEINKIRREARENKKTQRNSRPKKLFTANHTSVKRNRRHAGRKPRFSCSRANPSSTLEKHPIIPNMVPPELMGRLPSALKEINRKISAQNSIWLVLQTENKIKIK